jgi:D-lactate dehydrogenase
MALLEPDVTRIAPELGPGTEDRVPAELARGTPEPLRSELVGLLGADRVLARVSDLVRYASDASPYRLLPRAVVMARDAGDVAKVMAFARRTGVPVTFRAGGTSLNGQAQGDGIMVDVRRHWRGVTVEDGGARARVRPGTVLGHANAALEPYGCRLGPDPASTDIATAGGVIANNSGGMRCGVIHDAYQTVPSLTFVLPSGTVIDTAAADAEQRFADAEPELARGLLEIRDQIRADAELAERIRRKFQIKNTTGYRLVAFLDADTPVEIFRRLLVGSEGTLGFVSEAVFDTVPFRRYASTAFVLFPTIDDAVACVRPLVEAGASATELMMVLAMKAAQAFAPIPAEWNEAPNDAAAILVEFRSDDEGQLAGREAAALEILAGRPLVHPPRFTRDPELTEVYWRVREGLHGLLGKLRPRGTSLIIEDVCVPPARIAEAAADIRALLGSHGFLPGVAGHASAGNLHFMLTPAFTDSADRDRYEAFMGDLVDLILDKYDGSLKAEHGTGLNMAPYVEREWGTKATAMMWRIKALADPDAVLAPGVLLNRDPGAHLRNLKSTPPIEEVADTCVECGFCEPVCPSRHLTTTPRQRILLRREMARQPAGSPVLHALLEEYEYDAVQTCAADGSCALACPLGIDTGKLVKDLRAREHGAAAERVALALARRWEGVERAARGGLRAGDAVARVLGDAPLSAATGVARRIVSSELIPAWPGQMPPPAPPLPPAASRETAAAVYLPACINRIFGPQRGAIGLPEALVRVSGRAGQHLWIPPDAGGHCCATPWSSKGYRAGHAYMANRTVEALWRWTEAGRLPVVMDATSCTLGLLEDAAPRLGDENRERHAGLEFLDSIAWAHDRLLPDLQIQNRVGTVAVHPTCATRHLGLAPHLEHLAAALAEEVVTPASATCCGFAGDRGFLHPELTAAATADEDAELSGRVFDAHLCSNRTCEIGLRQGTGREYESFVFLLEELTRRG